jgi:hypothetical protein
VAGATQLRETRQGAQVDSTGAARQPKNRVSMTRAHSE